MIGRRAALGAAAATAFVEWRARAQEAGRVYRIGHFGVTERSEQLTRERILPELEAWPLVVLVDDAQEAVRTPTRFLWTTFTRFEPAADLRSARTRVHRHHLVYEGAVGIDARMKPTYPAELGCDPETRATVDRRWSEYFPGGKVEMGDSEAGHLDRA